MTYRRPGGYSQETVLPSGPIGEAGVKIPCYVGRADFGVSTFSKQITRGATVGGNDELMGDEWRVTTLPDTITDEDSNVYTEDIDYRLLISGGVNYVRWSDAYTKFLVHADTTLTDVSGEAHTITPGGTAAVSATEKKFGAGSLLLNGTTQYIEMADHADWFFDDDPFTIDMWVYLNALPGPGTDMILYTQGTDHVIKLNNTTGTYSLQCSFATAGAPITCNGTVSMTATPGPWYHIAIVRTATAFFTYLDGVQVATTASTTALLNSTGVLRIGSTVAGGSYLSAYVDEIRISKGVARWSAAFTPPTTAYSSEPDAAKTYDVDGLTAQRVHTEAMTRANSGVLDDITSVMALSTTRGPNYQVNWVSETIVIGVTTYAITTDYVIYQDTTGNYIKWVGTTPTAGQTYSIDWTANRVSPVIETATLTKGTGGSMEAITVALNDVKLLAEHITVGGIEYDLGTDYQLTTVASIEYVDWDVAGGAEPAEGEYYEIEYQSNDYRATKFFDSRTAREDYGQESELGIVAGLAFDDNACREAYFLPVTAETSVAFTTALALAEGKSDIDMIVCVRSDEVLTTAWNAIDAAARAHVIAMSASNKKKERHYITGVRTGTTPTTVEARATSLNHRRVMVAYPASGLKEIALEDETTRNQWLNGSFIAAAIAGMNGSHADVAHPVCGQQIAGFTQLEINPTTGIEFQDDEITSIASYGICFITDNGGVMLVDDDLTTDMTSELTASQQIQFIRDYVPQRLRTNIYNAIRGQRFTVGVEASGKATAETTMNVMLAEPQIVTSWDRFSLQVYKNPDNIRQLVVRLTYVPVSTAKDVDVYVTVAAS